MTVVTDNWARRNPGVFEHKRRNGALDHANDDFLAELKAFADQHRAVDSPFLRAIDEGSASTEAVRLFALDLMTFADEVPLLEGLIAAQGTWHSPAAVTMLSFGAALGTGYFGQPPLGPAATRLAAALGVDPSRPHDVVGSDRIGSGIEIYLAVVAEMADAGLTAGVGATLVDEEWPELAVRLKRGFEAHYGVDAEHTEVFDVLAAFEGPRSRSRWALLGELAQGGFHQHVIRCAVQETFVVWRSMWDRWLDLGLSYGTK